MHQTSWSDKFGVLVNIEQSQRTFLEEIKATCGMERDQTVSIPGSGPRDSLGPTQSGLPSAGRYRNRWADPGRQSIEQMNRECPAQ